MNFVFDAQTDFFYEWELLKRNKDETSGILWVKLISRLKQCANGLVKLRQTYSSDEEFCKKLDSCIKKLLKNI